MYVDVEISPQIELCQAKRRLAARVASAVRALVMCANIHVCHVAFPGCLFGPQRNTAGERGRDGRARLWGGGARQLQLLTENAISGGAVQLLLHVQLFTDLPALCEKCPSLQEHMNLNVSVLKSSLFPALTARKHFIP